MPFELFWRMRAYRPDVSEIGRLRKRAGNILERSRLS